MKPGRPLQLDFSGQHPQAVLDCAARSRKAEKIVRVLACERGDLAGVRMLEMGCGAGYMTRHFAGVCREVVATDIDAPALQVARRQNGAPNVFYVLMDAQSHALPSGVFDVVVCNHVYEHVPDDRRLMDEVYRLLAPGGICYFGAGNRLAWMEPHYRLPLLSVVPKWVAHLYLRCFRKQRQYYETHRTYWGLRALVARFTVTDYTVRVTMNPDQFGAGDVLQAGSIKHRLAQTLVRHFYWACPTFLWVLRRR